MKFRFPYKRALAVGFETREIEVEITEQEIGNWLPENAESLAYAKAAAAMRPGDYLK